MRKSAYCWFAVMLSIHPCPCAVIGSALSNTSEHLLHLADDDYVLSRLASRLASSSSFQVNLSQDRLY